VTAQNGRGQGDEPLYEGVVLPANGEPWSPEQQRQVAQQHVQPPAGQPWGQPWGPDSQAAIASPERPSLEAGGRSEQRDSSRHDLPPQAPPLPPSAPPLPGSPPPEQPYAGAGYGAGPSPYEGQAGPYDAQQGRYEAQAGAYGAQAAQSGYGSQSPYGGQPLPQADAVGAALPQADAVGPGQPGAGSQDATQMLPPQASAGPLPGYGSDSEPTQYIPPFSGGQAGQAGQSPGMPPHGGDSDATQLLPPQSGQGQAQGAASARLPLPPEGAGQHAAGVPGPYGGQTGGQGQANGQGAQAGPGAQPLAGFENLFRAEPAAQGGPDRSGEPGSTQSLPVFDRVASHQYAPQGAGGGQAARGGGQPSQPGSYAPGGGPYDYEPQGRAARRNAERGGRGSRGRAVASAGGFRLSPGVLVGIAIVVVGGVGVAAGAALSGGDDSSSKGGASSAGGGKSAATSEVDKAKPQAEKLDQLLDDSNNSRTAVVSAVENIKHCKRLAKAASDLRGAAKQRDSLVTRLEGLETGELPSDQKLTASLANAWKSSAAADNHYAAWAGQTAGKKGCHKGKARMTGQVSAGNRSSGVATNAKKQAAALWNPTAKKYGLKQREFGQL
jgi:hypothetical protein